MACLSVRPKCGELEINDNACEKVVLCHKVYSHLDICLHRMSSLFYLVDKKGNDQEPIQSNSTAYPKHQTGKGHLQLRRH